MTITKTLYVYTRSQWRSWLRKNHRTKKEIWLIYYKKDSKKRRILYNDAVEEALCFGWIDSNVKGIDDKKYAQRFTPRKPNSLWSAANRERVRRLLRAGKMTSAGLARYQQTRPAKQARREDFPPDILAAIRRDKQAWLNFRRFPASYRRVRIGWIDASRNRKEAFVQRLRYFIKMTKAGKMYGIVR